MFTYCHRRWMQRGRTIIESIISGTPTVCFDTSGPSNIVSHLENGYKAKPFCPMDLANGIKKMGC